MNLPVTQMLPDRHPERLTQFLRRLRLRSLPKKELIRLWSMARVRTDVLRKMMPLRQRPRKRKALPLLRLLKLLRHNQKLLRKGPRHKAGRVVNDCPTFTKHLPGSDIRKKKTP